MQQNSRDATEQRIGKRKSIGKRKLSDQGEPSQQQQQTTISELLSKNNSNNSTVHGKGHPRSASPSSNKRPRLSSPSPQDPQTSIRPQELISPDKMYNFSSNPESRAGGGGVFGRGSSASNNPSSTSSAIRSRPFNPSSSSSRQNNFSPHTGAKRLVVKNLRTEPRLNQDSYFEKVWVQLDAALTAVFEGRKPEVSLEELYKGAENVCRQGRAAVLAKKLHDRCREYVSGKLRNALVTKAGDGSSVDTLRAVVEAWSMWHSRLVCAGCFHWVYLQMKRGGIASGTDTMAIYHRLLFAGFSTSLTSHFSYIRKNHWLFARWA